MINFFAVLPSAVLALTFAIILSGCSDNSPATPTTNPQDGQTSVPSTKQRFFGLEFAVPTGWTAEQASGGLLLMAPQVEDGWQANVFLEKRVDQDKRSLEQALDELATNLKARKVGFVESNRKVDMLPSRLEYGLLEYSCTQQGTLLSEWEVIVILPSGERLFVLASSPSSRWNKYQPLFRSLLDSLH
jgi:hypothetical protein